MTAVSIIWYVSDLIMLHINIQSHLTEYKQMTDV